MPILLQVEGAAAKHGFEAALVICGNVVNEDASLGFTHTTTGAKKVRFTPSSVLTLSWFAVF